jgi:hypothetical protein
MGSPATNTPVEKRRGPGRPVTTGPGFLIGIRLHDRQLALIDQWIDRSGTDMTRQEAIRELIDEAVSRGQPKA